MSRVLTLPEMGIIVDCIYRNYSKSKIDQKSIMKLSSDCNCGFNVLTKVRNILASMKLLIIEGDRRTQKCYWHPDKCAPNPAMLTEVYRVYTKDVKSRIKVKSERVRRLPSIESALLALKKAGWCEVVLKKSSGYKRIIEEYDLSKVGE